ncbi:MAG: hypothetical protein ACRC2T_17270 [Thermoguttaceae bacterium]
MSTQLPTKKNNTDWTLFFSDSPLDRETRKKMAQEELRKIRERQGPKNFAKVFGKWPGDETDEEIEEFLKEIS